MDYWEESLKSEVLLHWVTVLTHKISDKYIKLQNSDDDDGTARHFSQG
jgi:hypothetical protein